MISLNFMAPFLTEVQTLREGSSSVADPSPGHAAWHFVFPKQPVCAGPCHCLCSFSFLEAVILRRETAYVKNYMESINTFKAKAKLLSDMHPREPPKAF